eukprot:2718692-Pleurochrysis_carterae.AAC.2
MHTNARGDGECMRERERKGTRGAKHPRQCSPRRPLYPGLFLLTSSLPFKLKSPPCRFNVQAPESQPIPFHATSAAAPLVVPPARDFDKRRITSL